MKKFNINEYMYIQITDEGWKHLEKTVGVDYINACIKAKNYTHIINGETWYRLQCWSCFDLMPPNFGGRALFNTNVMFDDEAQPTPLQQTAVVRSILNFFFPKKSKWIDIYMFENVGRYNLIQMRYRLDNNKKEFRIASIGFVNDYTIREKIYENVLLERS